MGGGLLQLVAYGAQDVYLTGNPQITYFKVVYRRHTNFAMETQEFPLVGNIAFGNTGNCVLSKNGDLISRMYLRVAISEVITNGNNFAWTRRLGHAIINNVDVSIGGTVIDRQYGTWIDIWYELARKGDHERGYNKMIGDVPELTNYNSNGKPQYTIYIPLQFWFNRNIGLSIPIIALQYHEVRISATFSALEQCIVRDQNMDITGISIVNAVLLVNYVFLDTEERRRFAQVGHEYLIEQTQYNGTELATELISRYTLDYNFPTKEIIWATKNGNYTNGSSFVYYSDRDDWEDNDNYDKSALEEASEKIIKESIAVGVNPIDEGNTGDWIEVPSSGITTIGNINITNDYSDSVFVNSNSLVIGTYSITDKIKVDVVVDSLGDVNCYNIVSDITVRDLSIPLQFITDTRYQPIDPIVIQFNNYGILIDGSVNPVSQSVIYLNGHERFDIREGNYFNYVQSDQHHSNTPKDGINVYSFSLFPEEHQPSGTANLSRIDSTLLEVRYLESTFAVGLPELNFLNADNRLFVFGTNYNILRILSGMGAVAYTSV